MRYFLLLALVAAALLVVVPLYLAHRDRYKTAAEINEETWQRQAVEYRAFIHADPHKDATSDGVPRRYQAIYDGNNGLRHLEMARRELPFKSITLERTGCFGPCPVYKVTFFRTGKARLEAYANMPMTGAFEGMVSLDRYARLCFAIERLGFASLKSSYRAPWTDDETCIVTVSTGHAVRRVSDYGRYGPIELWIIESTIDRLRDEVVWQPTKAPNHSPEATPVARPPIIRRPSSGSPQR